MPIRYPEAVSQLKLMYDRLDRAAADNPVLTRMLLA